MRRSYPGGEPRTIKLNREVVLEGLHLEYQWGVVQLHENGRIASCRLASNQTIQGVRCNMGDPITRYANGRLRSAVILDRYEDSGLRFSPGNLLRFDLESRVVGEVLLLHARRVGDRTYPVGHALIFDRGGEVIPTVHGTVRLLNEIPGYGGRLSASFTAGRVTCRPGAVIWFDDRGRPKSCRRRRSPPRGDQYLKDAPMRP